MNADLQPSAGEVRLAEQPPTGTAAVTLQPIAAAEAALKSPLEQADETLASEATTPAAPEIDTAVAAERAKLRERVKESPHLSRGMRDRLSALLETSPASAAGDSLPVIRAADALALLEEAIPPQLRLDPQSVARPEHPAGETFFTGDGSQISDEAADEIARGQLARAGYAATGTGG